MSTKMNEEVYRRCPERVFKVRLGLGPGPAAAPPIVKLLQELMPFSDGTRCGVRFGSNGFFGAPYHRKLAPVDDPCEAHDFPRVIILRIDLHVAARSTKTLIRKCAPNSADIIAFCCFGSLRP